VPVGSVDGHHYQAGPVVRALMADFQQLVRAPDCEGFGESTHLAPPVDRAA
jgi:branched-chain amino acid aminotransferase